MKDRSNTSAGSARLRDAHDIRFGAERPGRATQVEKKRATAAADAYARLTGRERSIVSELVRHKGAPNKVIAYALQISPNTLRNHLASIYGKLGVRRRVELVVYALEQGLGAFPDAEEGHSTSSGR